MVCEAVCVFVCEVVPVCLFACLPNWLKTTCSYGRMKLLTFAPRMRATTRGWSPWT